MSTQSPTTPMRIPSVALLGLDSTPVWVEVAVAPANDSSRWKREVLARATAALRASGYRVPDGRYTLNVAPSGPTPAARHLDLAVAVALLGAADQTYPPIRTTYFLVGELGLDGSLHPMRGAALVGDAAVRAHAAGVIVPSANAREAAAAGEVEVRAADTLGEVVEFLRGTGDLPCATGETASFGIGDEALDLAEVKGQEHAKRALEVAAAGSHHLLMVGPSGTGKTMLAQRLPSILPPLSHAQALEITRLHSVAGLLGPGQGLLRSRPCRTPHTTVSNAGLVGGGFTPKPGEVSLAHHGVLFLDELPEFRRNVLDVLRQPLADGRVTLDRRGVTVTYPSRFMLVAAMNPCPCGHHGDSQKRCLCAPQAVQRYLARVSGPLLDRIDLHVEVPAVRYRDLADRRTGEPSESIRGRVTQARAVQAARFGERAEANTNAQMTARDLREYCAIGEGGDALLRTAITRLGLSARAFHRVLKIARTIADLDGGGDITTAHVSEAIQYRSLDRALPLAAS